MVFSVACVSKDHKKSPSLLAAEMGFEFRICLAYSQTAAPSCVDCHHQLLMS
jgi:hypothetical protein